MTVGRLMSSILWHWQAYLRDTAATRKAKQRLRRASFRRDTRSQHAAIMDARKARIDGLKAECGDRRPRRVAVLNMISGR